MSPGHLADLLARGMARLDGERLLVAKVAAHELPAVGTGAEATALARLLVGPPKALGELSRDERHAAVAALEWAVEDGAAAALAPAHVEALRGLLASGLSPTDPGAWALALDLAQRIFGAVVERGREALAERREARA